MTSSLLADNTIAHGNDSSNGLTDSMQEDQRFELSAAGYPVAASGS
jgi:hypothetical protein